MGGAPPIGAVEIHSSRGGLFDNTAPSEEK
jgi:hypothetical protein